MFLLYAFCNYAARRDMLIKSIRKSVVNCGRVYVCTHTSTQSVEKWSVDIKALVGYTRIQRDREVGADVTKRPEPLINDAEQSAQLITAALSRGLAKNTN